MTKRQPPGDAVNTFITGGRRPSPLDPSPAKAPPPAWLDAGTICQIARLRGAERRERAAAQANAAQTIGQEVLDRRAYVAALTERIEREGWEAATKPAPLAPAPPFTAWWNALLRCALTDDDAMLLAGLIWIQHLGLGNLEEFLEALAAIDPQQDSAADNAALHALLAQPAPKRRRGRPTGRHPDAAAGDLAAARELFAKLSADGRLTLPSCTPWQLLQDLAGVVDGIIASDRGITNTPHLKAQGGPNSSLKQAWLGSKQRGLPPLRRLLVIDALAKHCVQWWTDEYSRETGPLSTAT